MAAAPGSAGHLPVACCIAGREAAGASLDLQKEKQQECQIHKNDSRLHLSKRTWKTQPLKMDQKRLCISGTLIRVCCFWTYINVGEQSLTKLQNRGQPKYGCFLDGFSSKPQTLVYTYTKITESLL